MSAAKLPPLPPTRLGRYRRHKGLDQEVIGGVEQPRFAWVGDA
jgi:hypothetical protein